MIPAETVTGAAVVAQGRPDVVARVMLKEIRSVNPGSVNINWDAATGIISIGQAHAASISISLQAAPGGNTTVVVSSTVPAMPGSMPAADLAAWREELVDMLTEMAEDVAVKALEAANPGPSLS